MYIIHNIHGDLIQYVDIKDCDMRAGAYPSLGSLALVSRIEERRPQVENTAFVYLQIGDAKAAITSKPWGTKIIQ